MKPREGDYVRWRTADGTIISTTVAEVLTNDDGSVLGYVLDLPDKNGDRPFIAKEDANRRLLK